MSEQHAYCYNPREINFLKSLSVNDKLRVKVSEVKAKIGKANNCFKPKLLPERNHIVCVSKQYSLVNNLISHPHNIIWITIL